MLGRWDLISYELSPEEESVRVARATKLAMVRAIARGELNPATVLFPTHNETDIQILFEERPCIPF
jgi:hypothetical protein